MYFQNTYSIVKCYKWMLKYRSQNAKSVGRAEDGWVIEAKWTEKLNSGVRNGLCVCPFGGAIRKKWCAGELPFRETESPD